MIPEPSDLPVINPNQGTLDNSNRLSFPVPKQIDLAKQLFTSLCAHVTNTQKLTDKELILWLPVFDEDCKKVHLFCQKVMNNETLGNEFLPKMSTYLLQMAKQLETAEKKQPSKIRQDVLKNIYSEINEIEKTIQIKSSLDLRDQLQLEYEVQTPEMPSMEEAMQPLSGWHFQNISSENKVEGTASQWKLDNLKNISVAVLYILGSPALPNYTSSEGDSETTSQNLSLRHNCEPINTAALPESLAKIDVTFHTHEVYLNDSALQPLVSGKANLETAKDAPTLATPLSLPNVTPDSILANSQLTTLASQSASVNQLHTFLASRGVSIDSKIYAHLIGHGNPMIDKGKHAGKDLEGLVPMSSISYQLGIAEAMLQEIEQRNSADEFSSLCCGAILGDPLIGESVKNNPKLLKDLVRQLRIAQYIEELFNSQNLNFNYYRIRIIESVHNLEPGQSFFFSGGWTSRGPSGHAISWGVTKQKDGKLTIRLHNTGAGVERHFSSYVGLESRSFLFTEIEDVDPKQFTASSFIQGMFNAKSVKLPEGIIDWGDHDIYNSLLLGMGGSLSTRQYSLNELAQPQFVGICAMESVMASIGTSLESETSLALYRFWATLKGTVTYFDQVKGSLISSEERRRLLYDGLKVLSDLANKALEAGTLTDAELKYSSIMIRQMNQYLKEVENKVVVRNTEQELEVTFNVPAHHLQTINQKPEFHSNEQIKVGRVIRPLVSIESETFSANPATVVSELKNLLHKIHLGNHESHNYLEVQKAVRGIVLKIPIQDITFWNNLDEAAANELLTIFGEISKEFLWSFIHNDECPQKEKLILSSEDYLCQAKLLTLADLILHRYNNPLGMKFPSLFQNSLLKLSVKTTPEWEEQFVILDQYWRTSLEQQQLEANSVDLFRFKTYPAGNSGDVFRRINMNNDFLNPGLTLQSLNKDHGVPKQWLFQQPSQADEAEFLQQWAFENPEKVRKIDPELSLLSPENQTAALLQQMDQLPTLRDAFLISYSFDFFLTGSFVKPSQTEGYDFSKGISLNVERFQKEIRYVGKDLENANVEIKKNLECTGLKYSLFGRSPYLGYGNEKLTEPIYSANTWIDAGVTYVQKASHLLNREIEFGKYLKIIFSKETKKLPERRRLDSNEAVIVDPLRKKYDPYIDFDNPPDIPHEDLTGLQISVQEFRELMCLSSDPAIQIDQTIGYFTERPHLLHKPEYQIYFRLLMTESVLLNERIKEGPHAAAEIAAFYQKMLNSTEEVNTIIFLAGMSSRLEEVYEHEKRKNPEQLLSITTPQFLDARDVLNRIIQSEEVTDEQRALANRELAISFRKETTLNPEEAIQLIQAVIYTHTYFLPEGYRDDYYSTREIDILIRDHFMPQLRELLEGEHGNQILSKTLKMLTSKEQVGKWTSPDKFPHFVSPHGDFELDVVAGTFKTLSNAIVPFNKALLYNDFMEEVFRDDPPKTMAQIDSNTISLNSKAGDSYQLVGFYNNKKLQRQFDGQWYQLQGKYVLTDLGNRALLAGKHIWYAPSIGDETFGSMILTDRSSQKMLYRAFLEKVENSDKMRISKVVKLDDNGQNTNLILVDSNRGELDPFHRLEAPDYILAWSQEGVIRQVQLPRFGLTFTIKDVNGKRQAICDDFPGYALKGGSKQHISEFGNLRHYMHLQRLENDGSVSERVIFARQPLKPYTQGSYLTNAEPNKNIGIDETLDPQERIEYQLIKGELVPTTTNEQEAIEANLFLAMTHLAERHSFDPSKNANPYERAYYYFEKANDQILRQREGLSLDTLEILRWIATQKTVTEDKHPDANALRLKAELVLLRNKLDFTDMPPSREEKEALIKKIDTPESFKERLKTNSEWESRTQISIQENYIEYLTHLKYVDADFRLARNEEMLLLQNIGLGDSRLAYRLGQLTSELDVTQRASLSEDPITVYSTLNLEGTTGANFPKDWLDKLLDPPEATNAQGILLRDINAVSRFIKYYAILRGDRDGPEGVSELNEGMGLHLSPSLTHDEMLQEIRTALKMTLAANNRNDDWFTMTLLALATNPAQFSLSSEELSIKIETLRNARKMAKELPKSIAGHKDYRFDRIIIDLRNLKYNQELDQQQYEKDKLSTKLNQEEIKHEFEATQQIYKKRIDELELQRKEIQEKINELQANLDNALRDISTIELLLMENLQAPTITLKNQGALGLSISTSSQVSKDSKRLRREKELAKQPKTVVKKDLTFSECINLDAETGFQLSNRTLTHPVVPQQAMVQLIRTVPVQQTGESTPALFQGNPKNARIKELFAEAEKDLADYAAKTSGNSNYEIIDPVKTVELCQVLRQNVTDLQQDVLAQEIALLQFANRGPSRTGELAKRDLQIEQGTLKLLTLDELTRAFFQRDLEVLHKRNPNLSREEMSELFAKIENYLLDATHLQQERRVLNKAEVLKKSQDDNLSDFTLQENIRAFVDAVGATRTYEPHAHPEYLVFEYYADILMWNLQVETLNSFGKKELRGALVELAMSLGKSSVIAPLLTWLAADGEQIASILTPEPLLSSMAKDLQETSGKVFAQKTRTIAIKRKPITTARLQRLLDNLDEVRRERFALVWSASDILSLFNQWVELNEQAYESKAKGTWTPEMQKELSAKRTLFLNNFKLLKESASLTVDEIHKVFDILQSHSFTFGSPKAVHTDISSGIVRLIDAIISDKELFETIHWEFLEKSKGESFTEESFHENVKGKIIDSLIERGIAPDDLIYRNFFRNLAPLEKQQLKEYLADGAQAGKGYHFLSNLEQEKGVDPTIAKKIRNELATLKETINHILPQTAGKKPLVHFGDDANGELVVPYHDGVPTVNSLFGSVLERLIYTAQYGLSKGISVDIVRKKIQQLKDNYETDRALGRNPDLSEFNRLVGGNKDRQFSLLKFKDKNYAESKYEEITKNINKNPEMILQLVAEYRLPSIKVYSKEIESSAHLIPLLAKEEQGIRGMSGTLFNVPTFPKIFQATKLSDTQAKTLQILLKNSNPRVATLPSTKGGNVADKIGMIDAHEVESGASLIDETGAFSGMSNEEVARHMLKRLQSENSKIQGIVYYDGNIKKVITTKDKAPVVYRKDMDRESLAAFWDLPHITGSDIPVGQFMKANMIVGKHTTLVSLMQGGWRLRGLAKGQAVNFMVPEEDKLIICKMLKEHLDIDISADDDLTFQQLVSYAYLNQALQESENTYQAVKESMKVALIKQVSNIAWNEATSAEDAMQIYEDTRSLFIKEEAEEPWDRWGHPVQEAPTSEALHKLLDDWKNNPIITKIRANPQLYKGLDLDALFKSWDEIIEKIDGPLPEKVKIGAQLYGKTTEQTAEQQVQQQQQQQVQQQVQQKVEKQVRLETGSGAIIPRQRIPVNDPFILKDAIPTPAEVLANIPEDELSQVFKEDSEKPKETGLCVKVDELLQRNKATKDMHNIFDEDLLASLNLAPVQGLAKASNTPKKGMLGRSTGSQMIYESFGQFQKPCSFVQVTQENGTGRLKLKLIDERDAGAIRDFIKKDRLSPGVEEENVSKLRLGLYQLQKGSYVLDDVGSQPIDLEKPATRERFMELLVQSKFAAGKVDFPPEELSYLEKWITKIGAIKAFELLKVILDPVAKGDTRKTFAKSSLAKIFEKQGVPRQTLASIN